MLIYESRQTPCKQTHTHIKELQYTNKTIDILFKGYQVSIIDSGQKYKCLSEFIITEVRFVWATLKSHALGTRFNQEVSYQLICDVSNFKVRTNDK